jgi:hypothetical protein
MKITKVSEDWYIGRLPGLVFFGYSYNEVLEKAVRYGYERARAKNDTQKAGG